MVHKELSAGVLGVTIGLAIGVGSVMYVQEGSLTAGVIAGRETVTLFIPGIDGRYSTRRRVQEREELDQRRDRGRENAGLKPTTIKRNINQQTTSPVQAQSQLDCYTVDQLRSVILAVVPNKINAFQIRDAVTQVLDHAADICVEKAPAEQQVEPTSENGVRPQPTVRRPRVDNDCERYGIGTRRYAKCVVAERRGERYEGGQIRGANIGN